MDGTRTSASSDLASFVAFVKTAPILALHHGAMKVEKCRRLERDHQTTTPLWLNPKQTESSDHAIQGVEIRRTSPRAIENQQLMFGENGFSDHGADAAGPNELQNCR